MKSNFRKISFAIVACLMIAAAQNSIHGQGKGGSESLQSANRIVGAWETTVTIRNCETGEQIGLPFPGVSTYNEGGTVTEFGANPASPYRTPAHGIWVSNGGGSNYSIKLSFIALTPAGAPIGRVRVTQDVELPRFGDETSTSGSFVLTNFNGVVLATGCSTATGVRVML